MSILSDLRRRPCWKVIKAIANGARSRSEIETIVNLSDVTSHIREAMPVLEVSRLSGALPGEPRACYRIRPEFFFEINKPPAEEYVPPADEETDYAYLKVPELLRLNRMRPVGAALQTVTLLKTGAKNNSELFKAIFPGVEYDLSAQRQMRDLVKQLRREGIIARRKGRNFLHNECGALYRLCASEVSEGACHVQKP